MSSAESGSEEYSEGERGFKLKKEKKKDKKDKDKKDKGGDKDKKEKKDKDKDKDKDKKDKKDKDKEKDKKDKKDKGHGHEGEHGYTGSSSTHSGPGYGLMPGGGAGAADSYLSSSKAPSAPGNFQAPYTTPQTAYPPPPLPPPPYASAPGFSQPGIDTKSQFPGTPSGGPIGGGAPPPPSGYRLPLSADSPFPTQTGPPVTYEPDGITPIFIGSALFETSVHPCKIGPHLRPPVSVAYGGGEYTHQGRYDLLPFVPEQMEWVYTSYGQVPPGRRPIEGGYEEDGGKLYHALVNINGIRVPGKTGEHLRGANVAFGGQEHVVQEYEILCWR